MAVRAGAFCAPEGASDVTTKGTAMTCQMRSGGRARWAGDGSPPQTEAAKARRKLLRQARDLGLTIKRNTPEEAIRKMIQQAEIEADAAYREKTAEMIDVDPAAVVLPEDSAAPELEDFRAVADVETTPDDLTAPAPQVIEEIAVVTGTVRPEENFGPGVTDAPATRRYVITDGPKAALIENHWGDDDSDYPVLVHFDGEVPRLVERLGVQASTTYVNGEPLGDHLNKLATDTMRLKVHPQEQVERIRALADALPPGSVTQASLRMAADDLDAPKTGVAYPFGTPEPLATLMQQLSEIPLARGADRANPRPVELQALSALAERVDRAGGWPAPRLARKIQEAALNRRHESGEGKTHIDQAVRDALRKLGS